MAAYFIDSSALVKRYVQEDGTSYVRALTHQRAGNLIYIVSITPVEITSAIIRSRNEKRITPAQTSARLYRFRQHLAGRYIPIEITPALTALAMKVVQTHGLRAYDAVQLAAALEVNRRWVEAGHQPVTLVSSDQALNDAAPIEGLTVEDPRNHP